MSIPCDYCDKFFQEEDDLFEHLETTHANKPLVRYILKRAQNVTIRKITKTIRSAADPSEDVEALLTDVRILKARIKELEAAPTQTKYVYKSDVPLIPWGDRSDKAMAERLIWDDHNPDFDTPKKDFGSYGEDHLPLMEELGAALKEQLVKIEKVTKKKVVRKKRKRRKKKR